MRPIRSNNCRGFFGEETNLEPRHLKCLLLVVTQNITTGSPWPISSNPDARYNDPGRLDCNLRIPFRQLGAWVRRLASR